MRVADARLHHLDEEALDLAWFTPEEAVSSDVIAVGPVWSSGADTNGAAAIVAIPSASL